VIFLDRFDFLKVVGLKLSPDGIQLFLLISLNVQQFITELLLLFFKAEDVVLGL
jgi:hypothetical protein